MTDACNTGFDPKALATLQARAALAGIQMVPGLRDGQPNLLATRWGYSKDFTTIEAASAWLDRVAGAGR